MGLALRKEDFEGLFLAPPAPDWSAAVAAVQDLKDMERLVDRFDVQTTSWIADLRAKFEAGFRTVRERSAGVPAEQVREIMLPLMDEAIATLEDTMSAHAQPLHEQAKSSATFAKLKQVPGGPGRFLRKQMNRIEDLRVRRYNALVDLYYGLLAHRSEYDEHSSGKSFSDAEALGDYLRRNVA